MTRKILKNCIVSIYVRLSELIKSIAKSKKYPKISYTSFEQLAQS